MAKQLVLTGLDLIRILEKMGFAVIRSKGSHYRLKHSDGRVTTVPVHGNDDLPKGLLRKIVREDLSMELDVFTMFYNENR